VSEKELLAGLPPYLFGVAATISFALAIYLALHDRIKASFLLGALAFVAALLAYLPQLESVSAFAVNVKLRNSLDRAEEILTRLRSLSVVNAKLAYTTLAWGNRMGAPKATEKQRLLDAMDEQLAAMNVSADERSEIKQSYVRFIAFDFYLLYTHAIDYALNRRMEVLQAKVLAEPNDANRTAAQSFSTKMSEWRRTALPTSLEQMPLDGFRKHLHDKTPEDTFSLQETAALHKLADQIADLFEASRRKGGYTAEAAEFYDKYNDEMMGASLYKLIFNATVSDGR
jgi:hypothetical protein